MAYLNTAAAYAAILAAKDTGNPADKVTWAELSNILRSITDDIDSLRTIETNYVSTALSYSNPAWLTGLAWSKISGTPTTLAGYGITDAVSTSGAQTIAGIKTFSNIINATIGIGTTSATDFNFYANNALVGRIFQGTGRWSIGYSAPTDGGFMLDVNGAIRGTGTFTFANGSISGSNAIFGGSVAGNYTLTVRSPSSRYDITAEGATQIKHETTAPVLFTGTFSAASGLGRAHRFSSTINATANNDTLVGVEVSPNLNSGAFSGVNRVCFRVLGDSSANVLSATANGQVGINNATPNASAILDITSTTRGFLLPRMTTAQRTAIASPAESLLVYDSTIKHICFFDGTNWQKFNHSPA